MELEELGSRLYRSWNWDTAYHHDIKDLFDPDNPSKHQCLVTSLVVQEIMGGKLMFGRAYTPEGRGGPHWWNVLPDGTEVDFTRQQFQSDGVLFREEPVEVDPIKARSQKDTTSERFNLLLDRVLAFDNI